jgi:hypothetical protein
MNPKQLKRIAVALVIVLFFWGMSEILGGDVNDTETGVVLPVLDSSEINLVVFETDSTKVEITRSGDSWTVNGFPLSQDELHALFAAVADSAIVELVATSAVVHQRMGVDSVSGIRVNFTGGGEPIATVFFGNSGRGPGSRYVRRDGSNFVYTYTGPLTRLVARPVDQWRDRQIVDISPDSVARVVVEMGGTRYSLFREGIQWRFGSGSPADSSAVNRLVQWYQALDATGFASEAQVADTVDFDPPDRRVTLLGARGDTLTSLVFDSTASGYFVQEASGGYVYRIVQWRADQMAPADSTLRIAAGGEGEN